MSAPPAAPNRPPPTLPNRPPPVDSLKVSTTTVSVGVNSPQLSKPYHEPKPLPPPPPPVEEEEVAPPPPRTISPEAPAKLLPPIPPAFVDKEKASTPEISVEEKAPPPPRPTRPARPEPPPAVEEPANDNATTKETTKKNDIVKPPITAPVTKPVEITTGNSTPSTTGAIQPPKPPRVETSTTATPIPQRQSRVLPSPGLPKQPSNTNTDSPKPFQSSNSSSNTSKISQIENDANKASPAEKTPITREQPANTSITNSQKTTVAPALPARTPLAIPLVPVSANPNSAFPPPPKNVREPAGLPASASVSVKPKASDTTKNSTANTKDTAPPAAIPPAIPSDAKATASTPKVGLVSSSGKSSASLKASTDSSSSSSAPPVKRPPPIPPREAIPIPKDAESEEEEEDEEEDIDLPELPPTPAKDEKQGKEPETALYIPKHAAIQQGTIFIKSIVDFEALAKKISSSPTDLKSVVFIQAHVKGWVTRLRYSGVSKKKIEVFKGLLKDQRNISRKLKLVSQHYLRPFKTKRFKGIQKGELDKISSEISFMIELHSDLLEFLVNIEKTRAPFYDNVGSIVSILTKNFQQVGSYIENIRVCKARLEACERSSPDFATLVNETYCNLGEESLYEILDMPVDQSQIYYDALISLQESTPPRCPDYEHLTESISQMQLIVNFTNNCIFKARNRQLCLEFENKIGGYSKIFQNIPERAFIIELVVYILEKKAKKKCVLTAFSDCIVLSKEKKTNQYAISEVIPSTTLATFSTNKNETPKRYTITFGNNKSLIFIMNDTMQEKNIPILSRHIDRCSKVKLNPFGSSLAEIANANASKNGVPELIVNIFGFLIKYVDIPGIFQVNSKSDELQAIRRMIEADPKYQFSAASDDCHAVANILKMFLRELNPGLFPQTKYTDVIDLDDIESGEKFVEAARELLDSLPREHKATLAYIISFFISFTKRSKNRVKLTSIGVILGPSLVRPETESVQTAQQIPKANSVIAKLAEHSDELGLVIQLPY